MLEWLSRTIEHLGYAGIGVLMFVENIILPLPAEVIMPLAGFVAARGRMDFPLVLASGFAGELLGAMPWYFLGRSLEDGRARTWLDRHGKWLLLRRSELERAHRWFEQKGAIAVFFTHLLPAVHPLIGVPAGVARMRFLPFLLYSAAGVAVWVAGLGWAGYLLGQHFEAVSAYLKPIGYGLGTLTCAAIAWWLWRRHRARRR